MKKIFLFLFGLATACSSYAQQSIPEKAKRFEFDIRTVNKGTEKSDRQSIFQLRLIAKENGNSIYECKLVKLKLTETAQGNYGVVVSVNTDSIRNMQFNNSMILLYMAILHKPLKVTVSPQGKLLNVDGVKDAIEEAAGKWVLDKELKEQLMGNSGYYPSIEIKNCFLPLPEIKIAFGAEWTSADPAWNYKVTSIKGSALTVVSSDKKLTAKPVDGINGTYVYNDVSGLLEQADIISKYKTSAEYSVDNTYNMKLRYNVGDYKVDTAWLNMCIKTGYWSSALKKGAEYDSAKVAGYFKAHDALYKNDKYYRVTKIGLIQQFRSDKAYQLYDSLLVETPNQFLKGNDSHLHNKIGSVLYLAADSAYEVSKYFYTTRLFDDWLQQSFAQDFIGRDVPIDQDDSYRKAMLERGWKDADITIQAKKLMQMLENAKDLLNLFHASKILAIRQKTEAMYLWVNAKNQKDDAAVLVKTANEFKRMSDVNLKQGDGNRYALITYNLLVDAGKQKDADALLSKTISTLEKYTADTLNTRRYQDKNLLAYAYYMQYLAAKPVDSVKALQYLSKATQYSPKDKKESAYGSFYDRVFLRNAKESYREEFIEKLFKNSNVTEALNVFVDHINANPEQIDEMQKVYANHFPKEDFKKFFAERILTNWQPAPAFILKDLSGKNRNLADYKNKWLVLDFWGTWCGPCRQEMPSINSFNKELADGKYAGVAFLSVACRDSEDKVKSYIDFNKFEIPVVMSDNQVEKIYKVRGYPSKVLVSPDGKMLAVNFGTDWQSIVRKFNELYTVN